MRAVFINLDRAGERRAFMERQFERLGLPLERFSAVMSESVSDETAARIGRSWERPLTRPELACFLSHQALWTEAARGDGPTLILEDDIVLSPRTSTALPRLAALAGVEFLNLESFGRRRFVASKGRPLGEGLSILRVHRDKSGSAAYLLWPEGARKLLDKASGGAAPVDAFLHGMRGLVSYQVEPALGMQLHLLAERGLPVPIAPGSFIQTPRGGTALRLGNLPFHARRAATQVRLAGDHLMRLFGRRYRAVDIDEADFCEDHSRS